MPDAPHPPKIGRPTLFETPASTRLYVTLTPAQREDLRRVARAEGVPVSAIIRQAVNRFTDDYGGRRPFVRAK